MAGISELNANDKGIRFEQGCPVVAAPLMKMMTAVTCNGQ